MSTPQRYEDYYATPEQYLTAEHDSTEKHEYVAGRIYAMAGATAGHQRIAGNISRSLGAQLSGRICEVFASDLRTPIHAESPVAVCEVLSPGTERLDQGEKLAKYRAIFSLRVYVLVSQGDRSRYRPSACKRTMGSGIPRKTRCGSQPARDRLRIAAWGDLRTHENRVIRRLDAAAEN